MATHILRNLQQAALKFAEAAEKVEKENRRALKKAATMIEREAKSEIGTYQDAVPPHPAWAPLAESTLANKTAAGFPTPKPLLRSGEMRDSISHEISEDACEAVVGSTSEVAVAQELGTANIPPRSFLGRAAHRKAEEIAQISRLVITKSL